MENIIVGVGGLGVSNKANDVIKTFALGSCVAMILINPLRHTAGMAHIALPDSAIDPMKAKELPGYFVDTGVPALFQLMKDIGALKNDKNATIKLVGGAQVMDANNTFNIGKRNILAIKKILWSKGMGPLVEDIGGSYSRTVHLYVGSGEVIVSSYGREDVIL